MLEKTVIIVKHDGVQRGLVGEIIKRFEQRGLKIVAMKMTQATEEMAKKQYRLTPEWIKKLATNTRKAAAAKGKIIKETDKEIAERVRNWNIKYLIEGPVIAMIFEGYHAIEIGRKLVGTAEPKGAAVGTIRGDFAVESYDLADALKRPLRNIVHASGDKEEAENEESVWFSKKDIHEWEKQAWQIIHKK